MYQLYCVACWTEMDSVTQLICKMNSANRGTGSFNLVLRLDDSLPQQTKANATSPSPSYVWPEPMRLIALCLPPWDVIKDIER